MDSQPNVSSFWKRSSFTRMNPKSANNATVNHTSDIFGKYPSDEERSGEIETDMDS